MAKAGLVSSRDAAAAFDTRRRSYFWILLNDAARMSTRNLARRLQLKRAGGDIAYRYLH
jgi:hypothetical protein